MDTFTAKFSFEKETKNTYKFQETPQPGSPTKIGSLYIQKYVFKAKPSEVTVTVQIP